MMSTIISFHLLKVFVMYVNYGMVWVGFLKLGHLSEVVWLVGNGGWGQTRGNGCRDGLVPWTFTLALLGTI